MEFTTYKGSRDFYPKEMRSRDWFFSLFQKHLEKFGFEHIDAPIIELFDLYLLKTSEEIVSRQIYNFEDRGGRKVAIRPEMTPTVARMVGTKLNELTKPIRWYSIPNLWRYEKPGRGRLREHWQLNADIFGAADIFMADVEILQVAIELLKSFGATSQHFKLKLNHRGLLNQIFQQVILIPKEKEQEIARILDKKDKVTTEEFTTMLLENGLDQSQINKMKSYLEDGIDFLKKYQTQLGEPVEYLLKLIHFLSILGYKDEVIYSPSIVRGFDYYTGIVFEVFDENPENNRSLFGGGRYDNLVGSYSKNSCNAVGFGMGDVTFENFLKAHGLYKEFSKKTNVYIATFDDIILTQDAFKLAQELRNVGVYVEINLGSSKLKKQLEEANQKNIPIVIIRGEEEVQKNIYVVKNMLLGEQKEIPYDQIIEYVQKQL